MTHSSTFVLIPIAAFAIAACTSSDASPNVVSGSLSALHAELDPENGGRFIDAEGREVMLSGINVNSLGEYWQYDLAVAPVFPFGEADADAFASIGWNVVRLLITWSLVEPSPGEYDEAYLDEVEAAVRLLESREIYTIIDLHQDAWDATLAARDDEDCGEESSPAFGWDGAPEWATLDEGAPRCVPNNPLINTREFSPAVLQAFLSFWEDAEGPGGVGIQTRFHAMLSHVAARFARFDSVLGYDPMNEPNAWSKILLDIAAPELGLDDQTEFLSRFYERALAAIREGEKAANSPTRLMLFEPSPDWAETPFAVLPVFEHDGQVVYSPHIYQGGITAGPLLESAFERAREEALTYGGVPVLSGEWGASPPRATDPEDDYFERHQGYQDKYRISATQWLWRAACGDPHSAWNPTVGNDPNLWGFYDVDCPANETLAFREDYAAVLRRPLLRAAPGPIGSLLWDYEAGQFTAAGIAATAGQKLLLFVHEELDVSAFNVTGLENVEVVRMVGPGQIWSAEATGASWALEITF